MTADLPVELYTAAQVRELDRIAIKEQSLSSLTLMERAGADAFEVLRVRYPDAKRLLVLCGGGNNAGDGYVLARLAHQEGRVVRVSALVAPERLTGEAATCARHYLQTGAVASTFAPDGADVIVDALLGSGLNRIVDGAFADAIRRVNESGIPTLALDLPSGLNADTGVCMGSTIRAAATIAFVGLKRGLFTAQGPEFCGDVLFSDLDTPATARASVNAGVRLIEHQEVAHNLPCRTRDAHKGHHGHVLVVGGDDGYQGAALLAACAAARSGAGLVTVATRPEHARIVPLYQPELMSAAVHTAQDLDTLLNRVSVVAIGPGLGQSDWAGALLAKVLQTRLPLVVDADALNLLASEPQRRANWVLTPHPGEAARLLGVITAELQADRFAAVSLLQDKFGGVVVLKGAGSLIAAAGGPLYLNPTGNPGMAAGGMGDVLTGIIAGLLAQGLAPPAAARCGVYLHGHAADLCAAQGERGLLAGDLLPMLRTLVNPAHHPAHYLGHHPAPCA
ncbi:MAG: NAD(P)H-hydrate dehydratase [Gammaproteobacteria bacterium]|nr:NAD(P)H-hydrate dehydratase [Gammaproteobacteria bacterium]